MADKTIIRELIKKALEMRSFSYVPYSGFAVGAALLAKNGTVYTGCNIENAAYGATICAERTAVFKAVSEGVKSFEAIVIVGAPKGEEPSEECPPCGTCRQVLSEFADKDFSVILAVDEEHYHIYSMEEMLPHSFSL